MEISRIGQAAQAMRQTEKQEKSGRSSSFSTSRMDKLELSAAVVDALRAKEREKAKSKGLIALMRPQQQKDPQIEAMKKELKTLRQCAKIAASLREGDNVPPEDLRFLLRNNPRMYTLAMAMRKPKEDPEDCKSVLEKEEEESSAEKVQESEGSLDCVPPLPETSGEPSDS